MVPGSIVLVGGDPGIGKSTLMLQIALEMATARKVLYVSGEESERQIKMRATRLLQGSPLPVRALPRHRDQPRHDPRAYPRRAARTARRRTRSRPCTSPRWNSSAGSVSQVRECSSRLRDLAKSSGRLGLRHRARHQGRRHRRAARPRAHRRYRPLPGGRPLPGLPPAALGQEPLRRHQRGGRLRDARAGHGRGHQPLRGLPGRAHDQRRRFGHRRDDGGHPPAAGRGAGADQPLQPGQPAPHPQRHRHQPPAAHHRRAHPPHGRAPGRAGRLRQRHRRDAHHRTRRRPGGRGCHRLIA